MKKLIILTIIGSISGFAYYYFIGCNTSCSITSSPINSVIYGALCGFIISFPSEKLLWFKKILYIDTLIV